MKNLLSLIFLLTVSLSSSAQIFNVNGQLTYSNGDPANSEYLEFYGVNSAGNVFVNTNTFSDTNGFYSKDLDVSGADSQNAIEVRMRDCDSTWITQTVFVYAGATDATVDFNYCSNQLDCEVVVEIIDQSGAPLPYLVAENIAGEPPFTYEWSNGELTGGIFPTTSGTYCVTMTDVNGCAAVSCGTVALNPPVDTLCHVNITTFYTASGDAASIEIVSQSGTQPMTYQWSTGQFGTDIFVYNSGTYCVTMTDADGCYAEDCVVATINSQNDCVINVDGYINPNGVFTIEALWSSNDIPTFSWSTGETTSSVNPTDEGVYCLEATFASGCVDTICYDYIINSMDCSLDLIHTNTGTGFVHIEAANQTGVAPYSYSWDFGVIGNLVTVNESGTYCVTMTDDNGCTAESCATVVINSPADTLCSFELTQMMTLDEVVLIQVVNQTGVEPYSYTSDFGAFQGAIIVNQPGAYCVTMTDAVGCTTTNCITVVLDSSCDTEIQVDSTAIGTIILTAQDTSNDNPPVSWSWTAGQTTNSIEIVDSGTYCVTVTHQDGCTSVDCYTHFVNPVDTMSCSVFLSEEIGSGGIEFIVANPDGAAPFTFEWNDGSTQGSVLSELGETYCITVTDADGCSAEDCLWVPVNFTIQGNVYSDSLLGNNTGIVYLIQFDSVDSTLTVIDSTIFGAAANGFVFSFLDSLPAGQYLLKAALDGNAPGYDNNLPTYFASHLFWDEADPITIPYGGLAQSFDINMVQGNNPGGPGFIGGYVTEGANKPDNNLAEVRGPGDPTEGVSILLLDVDDNPITHTITDEEGRYEFDDLPYGTYKVYVEITGKEQGMLLVTIDGNTPVVEGVNFNVNSTFTTTSVAEIDQIKSIQLFPNPLAENGVLNIALDMTTFEELTFEIISVNGNRLFSRQKNVVSGVNFIQLDMSSLQRGVYFLNLKSSRGVMTRKFIR